LCDNNREKVRANSNQRRARRNNAEGSHSEKEWRELKEKYNNRCAKCKENKKLTRDHIKPLIKGGSDYIINIQPLCRECNSSKGVNMVKYS